MWASCHTPYSTTTFCCPTTGAPRRWPPKTTAVRSDVTAPQDIPNMPPLSPGSLLVCGSSGQSWRMTSKPPRKPRGLELGRGQEKVKTVTKQSHVHLAEQITDVSLRVFIHLLNL